MKVMTRASCLLVALLLLAGALAAQSLPKDWKAKAKAFQAELNRQYADPQESPLDSLDRLAFRHHDFFPISKRYCPMARCILTPGAQPFEMPTVSGKTKTFVKVCMLEFDLGGRLDTLSVYRNLSLNKPEYADYLFIPFRDHTSGFASYGGGRYIDWVMPMDSLVDGRRYALDLNQCYNPYCAYSKGWNCPIPPQENYVDGAVKAGVRMDAQGAH
jgi:uncharacterized protein (DUF1684 family)